MNSLTLQSRLILAVILPCLALVVVGLSSLRSMSAMQAQTDRLYVNTAAPMRAMAEVASRIPRMRVGIDMMLLQETDLRDERGIRTRIVETRSEDIPEMRQAIEVAVAAQVDPDLKASAEALLRQFDAVVRDELNPLLAALERDDLATAQRIYRDQYALTYNRMRNDTNRLLDTLLQQAESLHGLSLSRYSSSKRQEGITIALGLLLSFVIAWVMIQSLRRRVTFLRRTMADAAQNLALDTRIELGGKDELAEIGNSFNQFIEKVHHSIDAVALNSRRLAEMAHDVAERARLTQANSASQRDRTLQVAAAIHELGATVGEIASNAASAATAAREATVRSSEGRQVVLQASQQINELSSELEQASGVVSSLASAVDAIGSTLATIRGISEQTNLLALNAAIEAARAGDQGRGFAVVADEVRTLAGRSAASTEEIQQVIDRLQAESERVVAVMDKGRSQSSRVVEFAKRAQLALEEINGHIGRISDQNTQVATATEEQSSVVEDIDRNVGEINDITMQTADIAQQLTESSVALQKLSAQLDQLVGGFRL